MEHRIRPRAIAYAIVLAMATLQTASAQTDNGCAPDVPGQFNALKHHGEALGFFLGAGALDPDIQRHYQGIQRLPGPGVPTFFVTKNGNPTVGSDQDPGSLLTVRLASRDVEGERVRSNRLERTRDTENTPPPSSDRVVNNIQFDSTDGLDYRHAGGIQTYGDILVVPLEAPASDSLPAGMLVLFDVANPAQPVELLRFPLDHAAGAAAIARLPDGTFIVLVGGSSENTVIPIYRTTGADLRTLPAPGLVPFDTFFPTAEVSDKTFDWPTGTESHQSYTFVEHCDGTLYLLGTRATGSILNPSRDDFADLYEVLLNGDEFTLRYVDSHHVFCQSRGGAVCDLLAAGGFYVSPSGELLLYGTEHENDGPGLTVRMGEFRHRDLYRPGDAVFRPASPARRPTASAGGTYLVAEGGSVVLSDASRPPYAQAWAEFYDDNTFNDRSVVFDFPDRGLDDFDQLGILDDFGDKTSSMRWASPEGCDVVLHENSFYQGSQFVLEGTGREDAIADFGSFGVRAFEFRGDTCDASDLEASWDVDGDGFHETPGPQLSFDAGLLDGPASATRGLEVCGAWLTCDEDVVQIEIVNVPPEVAIDGVVDELGQQIGAGVPAFANLSLRLDAHFTDAGRPDTHTASLAWGDGSVDPDPSFLAFSDSTGGSIGTIAAAHTYNAPGTFPISLDVVDDDGGQGSASLTLEVVGAAEALGSVIGKLNALVQDPATSSDAAQQLAQAVAKLARTPARNGALDKLDMGDPAAALVKIKQALTSLATAASLQPELDLATCQRVLTLAAKSIAVGAIDAAEVAGTSAVVIARARAFVVLGDAFAQSGDFAAAVDSYRRALAGI